MIAIACLRLFTFGPRLEPERSLPRLNLCITSLEGMDLREWQHWNLLRNQ